ncbi:MAG: hypothetical protein ABEJ88_03855 [Halobacterium sp.]
MSDADGSAGDGTEREAAAAALAARLEDAAGDPECAHCSKPADYFLYEAGRVETFVCWEHVSPFSAAVDEDDELREGRPVAVAL